MVLGESECNVNGRLALGVFVALNVLVSAALLWLACAIARFRASPDVRERLAIGFPRAFLLTLAIFLVGWLLLVIVVSTIHVVTDWPTFTITKYALPPLGVVVPLAILRAGLGVNWWRTIGVWIVWRVTSLAQVGLALLLVRAVFLDTLTELLPVEWVDWIK
jgi:hypothetical protein